MGKIGKIGTPPFDWAGSVGPGTSRPPIEREVQKNFQGPLRE
jgi:hypothetical protein